MRKKLLPNILMAATFATTNLLSQTTITIPLSFGNGQDSYLASGAPNNNYGSHPELGGNTWTCGGSLCLSRALFLFDMSNIPSGAVVTNASLQVFADFSWSQYPTTGGPNNSATISRITGPWAEFGVTWNNQPPVTTANQVNVPGSSSTGQSYTLNVKGIVQDQLDNTNYGFRLQMNDEVNYYLSMMFASSDNSNTSWCPLLTVTYFTPTVAVSAVNCGGALTATANVSGGSGNYSFTWTPSGQTSAVATNLSPGTYTLNITDNSLNAGFTRTISVSGANSVNYNVASTPQCGTGSASVSITAGSGNYTYQWSPGNQNTAQISNLGSGVYTVTVHDSCYGCTLTQTVQVLVYPNPTLAITGNTSTCAKQPVVLTASGANTYQWSTGAITSGITLTPTATTTLTVLGTFTTNNCSNSKSIVVTVSDCTGLGSGEDVQPYITLLPNPFGESLRVQCNVPLKKIELRDVCGKLVFEQYCNAEAIMINPDIPSGIYMLSIYDFQDRTVTRKVSRCLW